VKTIDNDSDPLDYYGDDEPRQKKRVIRCQCGTDLPGTCPGPYNCPYSGCDEDEGEEE
jgi:hypothetical protein